MVLDFGLESDKIGRIIVIRRVRRFRWCGHFPFLVVARCVVHVISFLNSILKSILQCPHVTLLLADS